MYAVFKNNLLTGNELIDAQHKELINRINKLVGACENGVCQLEAIRMLDFLSDYTDFHFREEEALQEKAGYPGPSSYRCKTGLSKQGCEFSYLLRLVPEL